MLNRIILSLCVFFFFGALSSASATTKQYIDTYVVDPVLGPPIRAIVTVPDGCVAVDPVTSLATFSVDVDGLVDRNPPYGGEVSMHAIYEGADWEFDYIELATNNNYNARLMQITNGVPFIERDGFHWGPIHLETYNFTKPAGFYKYTYQFGYRTDPHHEMYDVVVDAYVTVGSGTTSTQDISLDVKPGGCPNPLNTQTQGLDPVAIVGTQNFDVYTVDVNSILLEGVEPTSYSYEDVATPYTIPPGGQTANTDCHTAGADGIMDLVLHFDAPSVVLGIEDRLGRKVDDNLDDALVIYLTATLNNDPCTTLIGQDVVKIISNGQDFDGDGFVKQDDCDDRNPSIYPGAPEECDGVDNDCDGQVDPGLQTTYYKDIDQDGYGDPLNSAELCWEHPNYADNDLDCDDTDPNISPSDTEQCWDGIDNDCDTVTRDDCMLTRNLSLDYRRGNSCEEVVVDVNIEPASQYDGPFTCDFDWGDGSPVQQGIACETTHVFNVQPGQIIYDVSWSVTNSYGYVLNVPAPSVDPVSICRPAVLLNASHGAGNGFGCATCHTNALPDTGRSAICSTAACHGMGSPLPHADHSSAVIHGGGTGPYGPWSTECLDCHNPHLHEQLGRVTTHFDELYLLKGRIDTITQQTTTTVITYTDLSENDLAWIDPATWGEKDGAGRGLIFVPDATGPQETFEIVSATGNSITVNGLIDNALIAALTHYSVHPMEFGIIYGQFINASVNEKDVMFFGNTSFANNDGLGDGAGDPDIDNDGINDDSTPDGICQVCHTLTLYWRADGTKSNHNDGTNCSTCHNPVEGFKAIP